VDKRAAYRDERAGRHDRAMDFRDRRFKLGVVERVHACKAP
jgi:hypothetical protein